MTTETTRTRVGKIARLPLHIRQELNRRIQDGETGTELVAWLNSLEVVREHLKARFGGRPINEQNFSDWKHGGYVDWLRHQEKLERMHTLAEQAEDFAIAAHEQQISDRLAAVLTAELATLTQALLESTADPEERWKRLRDILRELANLRKFDHRAAKLRMEQKRFDLEMEDDEDERADRYLQEAKRQATAPILAAREVPVIAQMFGGGAEAEEIAAYLLEIQNDLKRGTLRKKPVTPKPGPNQPDSRQIKADQGKSSQVNSKQDKN